MRVAPCRATTEKEKGREMKKAKEERKEDNNVPRVESLETGGVRVSNYKAG